MRYTAVNALIILISVLGAISVYADDHSYALINGRVFDGTSDEIIEDQVILVADGEIESIVAAGRSIPTDYKVIDLQGYYLMPGLFDVHTHLTTLEQAQRALESGVTTVRSASVTAYQDVALQQLVEAVGRVSTPAVVAVPSGDSAK